jgi:type IV pilus assembly protein PilY1
MAGIDSHAVNGQGGKMKISNFFKISGLISFSIILSFSISRMSYAEVSAHTMSQFTSVPINLTDNDVSPQVMINTSNDHQLFFKAYDDYSDLDGDGTIETTYKHSIDYYGYFDCYKCYEYDSADQRFEPRAVTTDKYCTGANDAYWSGNFLNWATMTRIDAIRKILFGGHRRVDTSTSTILERAFLPPDIHSFAKHYAGADISILTPFTPNTAPPTGTSFTNRQIGTGSKSFATQPGTWIKKGDFLTVFNSANFFMKGFVTSFDSATGALAIDVPDSSYISGNGYTLNSWSITNHTRTGITIANTTPYFPGGGGTAASRMSENITAPPMIRVAEGNYAFWAAGEVNQCVWEGEDGDNTFRGGRGMNYNNPVLSEIPSAQDRPIKADVGNAPYGDFVARVQVGVPGLLGREKVKLYPYGNYKPIGLLQAYGDDDQLLFGMAAGTFSKSRTGGDMVAKIYNQAGASAICREINLGRDCDSDGILDDDFVDANHHIGDGTFKKVYQSAGGPVTDKTKSEGIINFWSLLRISGYEYDAWNYNSNSGDKCPLSTNFFGTASSSECTNWGNPFSEIYLVSLRYFAGLQNSPTSYQVSSESIEGINYDHGSDPDPLTITNYCARLSTINFNSSISSADTAYPGESGTSADELDTSSQGIVKDLDAALSSKQLTDMIGFHEGIQGNSWFVGENGTDNNRRCTAKTINSLGDVRGLCPEGPDLRGGYRLAGLSYYAHINDIRPTGLSGGRGLQGSQKVDTYAVKMSTGSPVIEIPIPGSPGQTVTILPSCIDNNKNDYGCTLVDFKVVKPHTEVAGVGTGKFLAIWEDSLQGNDYDLDAGGTIEYTITATQIQIKTGIALQNLGYKIGHGYVLSGTTKDGLHIHSGTNGFNYVDPTGIQGCAGCTKTDGITTVTYSIGSSSAGLLNDPLWYAAKWGGFYDSNGNNIPDLQSEWDRMNNSTGLNGSDGIPDNYFYAANPTQLEDSLNRVFLAILQRASSGTAAAVVSNNVSGVGALYQAYYEPLRKDSLGNSASWLGTVQALWMDSYGYLREDNGNAVLDNYNTDKVIQMYYDDLENKTRVKRYASVSDDEFTPYFMKGTVTAYDNITGNLTFTITEIGGASGSGPFMEWTLQNLNSGTTDTSTTPSNINIIGASATLRAASTNSWTVGDKIMAIHFDYSVIELEDIQTIWNGREQLSFSIADPTIQRTFNSKADDGPGGGRFIKTWIDSNHNSKVDMGEFTDFNKSAITPSTYGYLNVATELDAEALVDYIRGEEISAYRNRTLDYDGDGTMEVIRLGDIVNSTPTVVGSPQERLDLLYKDASYATFRNQYIGRRQVLYLGSNDGMLHAFNGGFYDSKTQSFKTSGKKYDGSAAVEHPLGAEIWAYVPMNLLPHLKWLKDINYAHVYYVDGKSKTFDAKIFANDAEHPDGWGTVLVASMRLGGGPMIVDVDNTAGGTNSKKFQSAYMVFDITNPEEEPRLLAEIQIPDGSFTVSYPAALSIRDKTTNNPNKWFLAFGSGPTSLSMAESSQNAKVYIFDLEEIANPGSSSTGVPVGCSRIAVGSSGLMRIVSCDTGVANSFVGDPISVDWDLNYKADSIYFGTAGDKNANNGRVMRMDTNEDGDTGEWTFPETLINVSQPVVAGVTPGVDETGAKWIYFGTGRFYMNVDQSSTNTQSIYGIKETGIEVFKANVKDVTHAEIETDEDVTGVVAVTNFTDLKKDITDNYKGWYIDLPPIEGLAGTAPATRVINSSALAGGILFTAAYQPGTDPCTGEGFSRLYGLYYKTGTAYPGPAVFGTAINLTGEKYSKPFIELGAGFATTPSIHTGSGTGDEAVSIFTQLSTGTIIRTEATTGNIRSGIHSWIEPR